MLEIFEEDVQKILKNYKIDRKDLILIMQSHLEKDIQLSKLLNEKANSKDILRSAIYKNFIKTLKKDIYYSLRKYYQTTPADNKDKDIAETHVSTKERLPYLDEFNQQITRWAQDIDTIVDLGGGVYPLIFPFSQLPNIKKYIWIDKDKTAAQAVSEFAKNQPNVEIDVHEHPIATYPPEFYSYDPEHTLVLMFKLIPVIWRQEESLIDYLVKFPAKKILITASKEAMTKKQNIERREDVTLNKFITRTNRKVMDKLDIENEFGYLLQ